MPHDIFPSLPPQLSEPLVLIDRLGGRAELTAFADNVLLEVSQGTRYEADLHMTLAEAKRFRANLDATITAAELLARANAPIAIMALCTPCDGTCEQCPRVQGAPGSVLGRLRAIGES